MGAKNTKGKFGLEKEVLDLVKQTKFTEEQVRFGFLGKDLVFPKVKQMREAFLSECDEITHVMSK